jgi:hypothetical protein
MNKTLINTSAYSGSRATPSRAECCSAGIAARVLEKLTPWRRPAIDPLHVEHLGETIAAQPALRQWLLVIASESPRVRRALLARANQAMRSDIGSPEASEVLQQLADARLLDAVTEYLLFQAELQPVEGAKRTGRGARVRFDTLGHRLKAREQQQLAA